MANLQKRVNDSLYSNSSCKMDEKSKKDICQYDILSEEEIWYECRFCDRDFRSEHGRSIHEGRQHRKELDRLKKKSLLRKPTCSRYSNIISSKQYETDSSASEDIPSKADSTINTNIVCSEKPSFSLINTEENFSPIMPPNSNSTVNFEPSQLLTETPDPSDDEDLIQFVNLNETFKHKPGNLSNLHKTVEVKGLKILNNNQKTNSVTKSKNIVQNFGKEKENLDIQFEYNKIFLELKSLEMKTKENDQEMLNLKNELATKKAENFDIKKSNIEKEETIATQNRKLIILTKSKDENNRCIYDLKKQLNEQNTDEQTNVEKEKTIVSQNRELMALKQQNKETERYIYDLKKQLNEQILKNQSIVEKEKTIASQNRELMALKHQDKETESYIYDLKKQLNDQILNNQSIVEKEKTQNRELIALKQQNKETESYIYDLKKKIDDQSEVQYENDKIITDMSCSLSKTKDMLKKSQDVVIDLEKELVTKERTDMDVEVNSQSKFGFHFDSTKSDEQAEIVSKIDVNNFRRNLDGTVDARDKNFRKCLQYAHQKPYPVNKDGSPDMRCTKNPHILKMKLDLLMKK